MAESDAILEHAQALLAKQKGAEDTQNVAPEQKKLDNEQKNDYISAQSGQVADDESARLMETLNNTFQGDPTKAVKSWLHSQKEFTKTQSSLKELQNTLNNLEARAEQDPIFKEILQVAAKGESVENYLKSKVKPEGKSQDALVNSKLDTGDKNSVNEADLVRVGLLDTNRKSELSALEWQNEVLQARLNYMATELPKQITLRTMSEIHNEQTKLRETQDRERLVNENKNRFERDFDNAILSGYDFTGEHKELYEEAVEQAKFILDPSNPKLIRPNAFSLALEMVARDKGIKPKQVRPLPTTPKSGVNYNGRNVLSGGEAPKPTLTPFEQARERIFNQNVSNIDMRKKLSSSR